MANVMRQKYKGIQHHYNIQWYQNSNNKKNVTLILLHH